MVAQNRFSEIDPVYWYFWIGLLMVVSWCSLAVVWSGSSTGSDDESSCARDPWTAEELWGADRR